MGQGPSNSKRTRDERDELPAAPAPAPAAPAPAPAAAAPRTASPPADDGPRGADGAFAAAAAALKDSLKEATTDMTEDEKTKLREAVRQAEAKIGDPDDKENASFGGAVLEALRPLAREAVKDHTKRLNERLDAADGASYTDIQVIEAVLRAFHYKNPDLLGTLFEVGCGAKSFAERLFVGTRFHKTPKKAKRVDEVAMVLEHFGGGDLGSEEQQRSLAAAHGRLMAAGRYAPGSVRPGGELVVPDNWEGGMFWPDAAVLPTVYTYDDYKAAVARGDSVYVADYLRDHIYAPDVRRPTPKGKDLNAANATMPEDPLPAAKGLVRTIFEGNPDLLAKFPGPPTRSPAATARAAAAAAPTDPTSDDSDEPDDDPPPQPPPNPPPEPWGWAKHWRYWIRGPLFPCKNHIENLAGIFGLFYATSVCSYKKHALGLCAPVAARYHGALVERMAETVVTLREAAASGKY